MKLREALEIAGQPSGTGKPFRVFLACGFTPLDLKTFVTAHLRLRLCGTPVEVESGLFGDLTGSLERLRDSPDKPFDLILIALEWPDLDSRLSHRSTGSWEPEKLHDLLASVESSAARLLDAVKQITVPTVVSQPTLPLPPMFPGLPESASSLELALVAAVAYFAAKASHHVQVLNPDSIDLISSPAQRLDLRTELDAGFPYQRPHAEALARLLCAVALPERPKKGLITDLDGTVWAGILGEDGIDGITWDLEHRTSIHAVYQKTLASLAASGALVAIASKNDPALVRAALRRNDLLVSPAALFPIEAHWSPKSDSVRRILEKWNILAEDVVVVDDDPAELGEIEAAHPGVNTLLFPNDDPVAAVELMTKLRTLFSKREIHAEDKLRAASLQQDRTVPQGGTIEDFLAASKAVIAIDSTLPSSDGRALDLVNKTNQFNLNGRRFTPPEWSALLARPGAFVFVVSYEDRFGPLGRIAVLAGQVHNSEVQIDVWAMSCRAFSRRIEHHCLQLLFDRFGADSLLFEFHPTERNAPLREFLKSISGEEPRAPFRISKERFEARRPALYHRIQEPSHV